MSEQLNGMKKNVKNWVKSRNKVKLAFLQANKELYQLAKNTSVRHWTNNSNSVLFVQKAREQIGYSPKTFGYDILISFVRLERTLIE